MMDRLVLDVMRLAETEREAKRRHASAARSEATGIKALSAIPPFSSLPRSERKAALRLGDELVVASGVHLGPPSYRSLQWVVVLDGAVAAYRDGEVHRVLGPGDHAGLTEMVEDGPMEQGLLTVAPSRLLVFGPRQARGLLAVAPKLRARVSLPERVIRLDEGAVVHGRA